MILQYPGATQTAPFNSPSPQARQAIQAADPQQDEAQRLALLDQLVVAESELDRAQARLDGLARQADALKAQHTAMVAKCAEGEVLAQQARGRVRDIQNALRPLGESLVDDACNMLAGRIASDEATIKRLDGVMLLPKFPSDKRRPDPAAKRRIVEMGEQLESTRAALARAETLRRARLGPGEIASAVVEVLASAGINVTVERQLPPPPGKPDWHPAPWSKRHPVN
jgi:hypothetical protein